MFQGSTGSLQEQEDSEVLEKFLPQQVVHFRGLQVVHFGGFHRRLSC